MDHASEYREDNLAGPSGPVFDRIQRSDSGAQGSDATSTTILTTSVTRQ